MTGNPVSPLQAPDQLWPEGSWQSPLDPSRRYGVRGDRFYKIALQGPGKTQRRHDLSGEIAMLERSRGVPGIPEVVGWHRTASASVLITGRLGGRPLSQLDLGWGRLLWLTLRLALLVVRLARRGVSHDDLRSENVLLDPAGRLQLIDFDQASLGRPLVCLARSLLGLRLGGGPVANTVLAPLREQLQASLPPAVLRRLEAWRGRGRRRPRPLPPLPQNSSPDLRAIHAAWQRAALAEASSPGRTVAYHELEFEGLTLPGERPFALRWQALGRIADCRGKRVLELGCNQALLSTFLLKEAGAAAALAVDRDPEILEAAAAIAAAFHVRPEFRALDFDADQDWEAELLDFRPDVAFALSVAHWVQDQARFFAFLARFDELIYEGHDRARTERRRLAAVGFDVIELIHSSERGRPVLHCRKGPPLGRP